MIKTIGGASVLARICVFPKKELLTFFRELFAKERSYLQKRGVIHERKNYAMRCANGFEACNTGTEYTKQTLFVTEKDVTIFGNYMAIVWLAKTLGGATDRSCKNKITINKCIFIIHICLLSSYLFAGNSWKMLSALGISIKLV